MAGAREPDATRALLDAATGLVFEQARRIEELEATNVELAVENLELRDSADDAIAGEYDRLVEGLLVVEAWARTLVAREPDGKVDAESLVRVLGQCFDYAEQKRKPTWYDAAVRAMGGLG